MDKDIRDIIIEESKKNMPDLWDKIESKLEDKKSKNKRKFMAIAASLAVVLTIGIIGDKVIYKNNAFSSNNSNKEQVVQVDSIENNSGVANAVEVLEDLNLDKILEGKTVMSMYAEKSYANDSRFINYEEEAEAIVYGKVINVRSYIRFASMIFSDVTIEVMKDYRNILKEGDTITICAHGGELTYDELISQLPEDYVKKHGYNNVEDKSQKVIEVWDGIPVYRVGEYVLVYANNVASDPYYKENEEYASSITHNYDILKGLYVNPNSKEIFDYEYLENGKLVKNNIGNLESLENKN